MKKLENEKESAHIKRMFEISNNSNVDKPLEMSFAHATMLAQTFSDDKSILASLKKTGQYDKTAEKELLERVAKASQWVRLYAPEELKFVVRDSVSDDVKGKLSSSQKSALKAFAELVESKEWSEKELFNSLYELTKKEKLKPKEFFRAAYLVLLEKEKGPRLVPFVLSLGEKATRLFQSV